MPQSKFSGNGAMAPVVTPLFPFTPGCQRQDGRQLWRRGEPTCDGNFTFRSRHIVGRMFYTEDAMAIGEKEIFLTGACLQEQVDRVLEAKSYAKIKAIKPVLERMAKTHMEMLANRLEGSEESEEKEAAPSLRQEDGAIEPFENLGYQQTGSVNG